MGWEVLIIPIIGVAVWIISTLIRGAEQAKDPERPAQRKPEKVTDLDRFLREVHRRRQGDEREEERPTRAEPRREPPRRAAPRTARPQEEVPVALPVEEVLTAQPASGAPVLRVHEAPPLPGASAEASGRPALRVHQVPRLPDMPPDTSARSLPQLPPSAALAGLKDLLRSREGLCKAMILQEVFGPPRSRRGRVR